MGNGSWSASTYSSTTARKIATGTSFGYSTAVSAGTASGVHESLDPQYLAKGGPFEGKRVREARDSDEHPNSVPIAVLFDETASMGHVPALMQKKLAELFGLLLRKGYVEDPQLLVGAYGDAQNGEQAPVQVGQFESDNRADETLDNIVLEMNGGGNGGESVHAAWYFLGQYAELDSLDKRGKKGYLVSIGDEVPNPVFSRSEITTYIGECPHEKDLTREECLKLAQEKFEVYHVVVNNMSASMQDSINVYNKLLGKDHVVVLEDEENVAEVIAVLIGMAEGSLDSLDEALDDLDDVGATASAKASVSKALATFTGGGVAKRGNVAVGTVPNDLEGTGATRL